MGQQRGNGATGTMSANSFGEVLQHVALLAHTGAHHRQELSRGDLARRAATAERRLAPLHGRTQLSLGNIVRRLDSLVFDEGQQPFRVVDSSLVFPAEA